VLADSRSLARGVKPSNPEFAGSQDETGTFRRRTTFKITSGLARKSADQISSSQRSDIAWGIEAGEVKPINGGFDAQREK
jgi:hypothetical protein